MKRDLFAKNMLTDQVLQDQGTRYLNTTCLAAPQVWTKMERVTLQHLALMKP